jgi:hypothetical protein
VEKYGTAGQATDGTIIRRMRFACWITKPTDTHSEYVILIVFPWQEWLCERGSMLRYGTIIRRMRFACWITKATHTHSEYVILIAFPWQEWLCERGSMLRYKHTVLLNVKPSGTAFNPLKTKLICLI